MAIGPNVFVVSTAEELKEAVNAANDGDRIELAPGAVIDQYVRLKDKEFATGITITSQDVNNPGSFVAGFELFNVDNATLSHLDFTSYELPKTSALFIRSSDGVTLTDLDFDGYVPDEITGVDPEDPETKRGDAITGYGYGRGLRIAGAEDLVVTDSSFTGYRVGIRVQDVIDGVFSNLELHGLRDGLLFTDVIGLTIEDSYFHDFKPWLTGSASSQDHPDMIQYWGKYASKGNHDVTIQGNIFEQSTGWTQTIFGEMNGAPEGMTATNFQILDNVIINDHTNAIRLHGVEGALIENNLILDNDPTGTDKFPRIFLKWGITDVTVSGNALVEDGVVGWTNEEAVSAGNWLLSKDSNAPDYWAKVLEAYWNGELEDLEVTPILTQLEEMFGDAPTGGGDNPNPDGGEGTEEPETGEKTDGGDTGGSGTDEDGGVGESPKMALETGTLFVSAQKEGWHSVSFSQTITNARVVMGPPELSEQEPATVRLRNVTDEGFQFKIDEWNYQDGHHGDAELSWMAVSEGKHVMADGTEIFAGRVETKDTDSADVQFSDELLSPVVLAQVSSSNGAAAVTARIDDVASDGFRVWMQEEEANNGLHKKETIDWISFETVPGGGVTAINARVQDSFQQVNYTPESDSFAFFADMQSAIGKDPATVAHVFNAEGVLVKIQEETSLDNETDHYTENVALLWIDEGVYDLA